MFMIMLICPKDTSGYNSTGRRVSEMTPIRQRLANIITVVTGLLIEKLDRLIGKFSEFNVEAGL
jgi:hypothetical protein